MKRFLVIFVIALFTALQAEAGTINATTTITKLYTYEQAGFEGDLAIKIADVPVGCEAGFWVKSSTTTGYKNIVSFLLSAFHTGTQVHLSGNDSQRWTGSAQNFCRLDEMALVK